jgi:opacity protein-like surface antigen
LNLSSDRRHPRCSQPAAVAAAVVAVVVAAAGAVAVVLAVGRIRPGISHKITIQFLEAGSLYMKSTRTF